MENLIKILIKRLTGKGMEISTIPAFVRDVANTVAANGNSSLQELNMRLESLGWNDLQLDDYTLQLILATFEPDLVYKPPHWFDRTFDTKRLTEAAEEETYASASGKTNKPLQE